MVGIFAFRVNDELLYAPVFFINGSIKGTDLLYRHKSKKFVPLNVDWCKYLISLASYKEGESFDPKNTRAEQKGLSLEKLIMPPDYNKSASYSSFCELNPELPAVEKIWDSIKEANQEESKESLLKKFILEDGGMSAVKLITDACGANSKFASYMLRHVGEENFLPAELIEEKKASSEEVDRGLHVSRIQSPIGEKIEIQDNRRKTVTVAFDKRADKDISNPNSTAEKSKFSTFDIFDGDSHGNYLALETGGAKTAFVETDTKQVSFMKAADLAFVKEAGEVSDNTVLDLEEDKTYLEVKVEDGVLKCANLEALTVLDTLNSLSEGVNKYWVKQGFFKKDLTVNPASTDVRYLEVAAGYTKMASKSRLNSLLNREGFGSVQVEKKSGPGYFVVRADNKTSLELSKFASEIFLMGECGFNEKTSKNALDLADSKGMADLFYMPLDKSATSLSFENPPEFYQGFDSSFNVPTETSQSVEVISDSDKPHDPKSRVGDSVKFTDVKNLDTHTPESLAQLADQTGESSLFDHGMVGTLSKTYDSSILIEKYLVDLEKGLDKLGRILFLFYWKPEDFSSLYGSDDQSNLESMLLFNFKSLGDLVIELLRKTKFHTTGLNIST
jgi:hypothetical protein